jgi:hypothetical protein
MLTKAIKNFQSDYKFVKNPKLAMVFGVWCFAFTLFACVLGMVPKVDFAADPSNWWFQLISNIITPIVLVGLGLILPAIARRNKAKELLD